MERLKKINYPLLAIILIATVLRFLYLDKPGGLWYDELVSYNEAIQQSIAQVISYTLKTDVHLPLYPVILHLWSKVFSISDLSLRAFSAVCGVLTVITAYFAGKELGTKKTGLLCASVFALNSFLIYFSQEVRLYSLQALTTTIFIFFLAKVKNDDNNKNYAGLIFSAFLVISLYTISFIYVIGQLILFGIYLFAQKNIKTGLEIKKYLISLFVLLILNLPLIIYLCNNYKNYTNQINGYYCDYSSFILILQNWLTPRLEGLYNNFPHYLSTLTLSAQNLVFIFIPIALCFYFIYKAIKKERFSLVILGGAAVFMLAEIIAFQFTNFKVLSRYTILVLPNILLLIGIGMDNIKSKKVATSLISIFFLIQSTYLVFSHNSAYKLNRNGFRGLAEMINSTNPQKGDFIVVWNRTEILDKYVRKDTNKIGLLKNIAYTSEIILQNEEFLNKLPLETRKKLLRDYFKAPIIPQNTRFIMDSIEKHMGENQKIIISTTDYFNSFDRKTFKKLIENDEQYNKISYNDLLTIKALLDLKEICGQKFEKTNEMMRNSYVMMVYKKRDDG